MLCCKIKLISSLPTVASLHFNEQVDFDTAAALLLRPADGSPSNC